MQLERDMARSLSKLSHTSNRLGSLLDVGEGGGGGGGGMLFRHANLQPLASILF